MFLRFLLACTPAPPEDGAATACDTRYYYDADGDGFGDEAVFSTACTRPSGYLDTGGDCDDLDPQRHPGAPGTCDDDPCPGGESTFFADTDGDGHGDEANSVDACEAPAGFVEGAEDCNDADAEIHPDADETCNDDDDDCDGEVDDDPVDASRWWPDEDADGFGAGAPIDACEAPSGHVTNGDDCDDADPTSNPGAPDFPDNGKDEDCDGVIDG